MYKHEKWLKIYLDKNVQWIGKFLWCLQENKMYLI